MSRYYLGIACTGHDNAIAIVDPRGNVVFAEAAERYLQNKRGIGHSAEDLYRLKSLLDVYCRDAEEIVVAKTWSDDAPGVLSRIQQANATMLTALDRNEAAPEEKLAARGLRDFQKFMPVVLAAIAGAGDVVTMAAPSHCRVIQRAYPHHLTHAATACYTAPTQTAACAVVDGFGEGANTSFYEFSDGALRSIDQPTNELLSFAGIGIFYMNLCELCGFNAWQGEEWKVMGLASYGHTDPTIYRLMQQCIVLDGLTFVPGPASIVAWHKLQAFGRRPGSSAKTVANLAATGQQFFADLMTALLTNLHHMTGADDLIYGGGCALNSSYNGQICTRTPFKRVHVFSAPADDGNAIGAALLAYVEDHGAPQTRSYQSPYLGSAMADINLEALERFSGMQSKRHGENLETDVAQWLAEGKIIAWAQGRAEFGPRALGNRSILADPRTAAMRDRINETVKFREKFRPLAPAILHEYGPEYFIDYEESPYMERTLRFRDLAQHKVPAVVHVDGTGRLQTVKREWNPRYHRLISEFHRITGVPMLLNTSLNVMGKPIVHSVEDVVGVFLTSGIDVLVIGDLSLQKR